jgi:homoserine O-succinyltransferase/O-acetyltransferase
MPVCLISNPPSYDRLPYAESRDRKAAPECEERSTRNLAIGLINNMPDGALEATERQFLSLLESASDGISICLSLYSMPGVPRSEAGARHISNFYTSAENLGDIRLDGLIVTGREPLTSNLADEPYWESFKNILNWAQDNTYSTIWSCLAAHAAVQYMDGITRVRSHRKHCGVFDCTRVSNHILTEGAPQRFQLPHSRWNGLPEEQLADRGYELLSRAEDAGVDAFCKQDRSLFVFFQGHPEYESTTLLLEYRRDAARYLKGESENYPSLPRGYFDPATMANLTTLQQDAVSNRRQDLQDEISAVLEGAAIENTWHSTAACIYRNWLRYVDAQKTLPMPDAAISSPSQLLDDRSPLLTAVSAAS